AVSTRREPAAVFAALTSMIAQGRQVPVAAQGLRALPREAWPADGTRAAADAVLAWAEQTHPNERSGRDYAETIQLVDELAMTLPAAEADSLRQTLSGFRVSTFVIRSVVEGMRYDTTRIV